MEEIALSNNLNQIENDWRLIQKQIQAFNRHGQFEYTFHENMFAYLFPQFDRQITFGTGKGGLEEWGTKKFTVDFYNPVTKEAVEIDGKSHNTEYQKILDKLKYYFLKEKGITLLRIKNEDVEELYKKEQNRRSVFGDIFNEFYGK